MQTLNLSDESQVSKVGAAYLNECIVEQKHGCSPIPNPGPTVVKHLANVTYVSKFGMTKTELPGMYGLDLVPTKQDRATHQTIKLV